MHFFSLLRAPEKDQPQLTLDSPYRPVRPRPKPVDKTSLSRTEKFFLGGGLNSIAIRCSFGMDTKISDDDVGNDKRMRRTFTREIKLACIKHAQNTYIATTNTNHGHYMTM